MRHLIIIFLLTVPVISAIAQRAPRYTISGFMRDSLTTESLISATVYNKANLVGTSTNSFGFYSLTLPEGKVELVYSYVGYHAQTVSLNLRRDTVINVSLAGSLHLQEVTVTAGRASRIQESTQMSTIKVPMVQIKSMPAFLGEVDLLKILQLMPGIQSGGEGNSGLYVRGGGPDQNLFLLDGIPMYNVSHLFGFFSVFNADAINSMEVIKGGFPARYGGRLSSVLDISMKEGNMQKFGAEGSIGIVSAKLMLEGPIVKDKTSFIITGRRSHNDALAASLINLDEGETSEKGTTNYYFYDLTAKINHRFSANDRIYLSAYIGSDRYSTQNRSQDRFSTVFNDTITINNRSDGAIKWDNSAAAFRWNHIFTPKLFSNTTLSFSRYRHQNWSEKDYNSTFIEYNQEPPVKANYREYYKMLHDSGVEDWSGKISFDYLPSPDHYIRFGVNAIYHAFNVGANALNSRSINKDIIIEERDFGSSSKIYAWEYSAYVEDDIKLSERLKANVGLHWSAFSVEGKLYNSLQPRISARYLINPQLSVKTAYSRMAQYVHLLTSAGIGLSSDLWVPSTARMRPQTSDQLAVGLAQNFREVYEISFEGYYKSMSNVLEYREGSGFFDAANSWEQKVVQGKGRSYGMELFVQKKTGSFTGWVGYALSWTDRLFDELNFGRRFPYKYDRRHDISIAVAKRFGEKIEMSGTWVFGTGICVTPPVGIYPAIEIVGNLLDWTYYDYGDRNSYRMKAYHRLDLSVTYTFFNHTKWGKHQVVLGVYNAYNRKNPFYIEIEGIYHPSYSVGDGKIQYRFAQYALFPIIPSLSYHFKF